MARKLKSPKSFREVFPRVCGTCHFMEFIDENGEDTGMWRCRRDPDYKIAKTRIGSMESVDMMQWFHTCDRWKQQA